MTGVLVTDMVVGAGAPIMVFTAPGGALENVVSAELVSGAGAPNTVFTAPVGALENVLPVELVLGAGAVEPITIFTTPVGVLETVLPVQTALGAIKEGVKWVVEPDIITEGAGVPEMIMSVPLDCYSGTGGGMAVAKAKEALWWDEMLDVGMDSGTVGMASGILTVCVSDPITPVSPSQLGVEEGAPASGQPGAPPLWFHGPSPMVSVASGISPQVPPLLPSSMDTEVRKEFTRGLRGSVNNHSYPVRKAIHLPGGGMYIRGPSGVAPPELTPHLTNIHVGVDLPWGFLLPSPGRHEASGTPSGALNKADWRLLVGPVLGTILIQQVVWVWVGTVSRWYKLFICCFLARPRLVPSPEIILSSVDSSESAKGEGSPLNQKSSASPPGFFSTRNFPPEHQSGFLLRLRGGGGLTTKIPQVTPKIFWFPFPPVALTVLK